MFDKSSKVWKVNEAENTRLEVQAKDLEDETDRFKKDLVEVRGKT